MASSVSNGEVGGNWEVYIQGVPKTCMHMFLPADGSMGGSFFSARLSFEQKEIYSKMLLEV